MIKKTAATIDYYLLAIDVAVLLLIGLVELTGVSVTTSWKKIGGSYYFLFHQIIYGLIPGIILGFFAFRSKFSTLRKISLPLFAGMLFLTLLVFIPKFGTTIWGSRRWIKIGILSFQPSEFLKLSFIIYISAWLSSRAKKEKNRRLFLSFLTILGLLGLILILQPDISTLAVIAFVGIAIYFSSKTPAWQTIFMILTGVAGISILIKTAPYRLNRLLVFLHPETDPLGIGYQIKQSLIAIGSGRIFGTGLGLSNQKLGFLPQPMSDSIFAVFAEETGLVGSLLVIFLFLIFAFIGFKIAKACQSSFLRLMAVGITSWISIQAFINIGSMIGILPLTGIPMPFFSYGGSAMIAELTGIGILLNIAKHKNLQET